MSTELLSEYINILYTEIPDNYRYHYLDLIYFYLSQNSNLLSKDLKNLLLSYIESDLSNLHKINSIPMTTKIFGKFLVNFVIDEDQLYNGDPMINDLYRKILKILYLKNSHGYDHINDTWRCVECGIDMGKINPRQLCNKTYCGNI
jgi:hypothetical protein